MYPRDGRHFGHSKSPEGSRPPQPNIYRDPPDSQINSRAAPTTIRNYKTKPCRHFELGKCKLGALCNFSHGNDQQQTQNSNRFSGTKNVAPAHNPESRFEELEGRLESFAETQRKLLRQAMAQFDGVTNDVNSSENADSENDDRILQQYC